MLKGCWTSYYTQIKCTSLSGKNIYYQFHKIKAIRICLINHNVLKKVNIYIQPEYLFTVIMANIYTSHTDDVLTTIILTRKILTLVITWSI